MSFTDPIGDMIARIRNAQMRTSNNVAIPNSKFRVKILEILKQEGYISDYKIISASTKEDTFSERKERILTLKCRSLFCCK